MVPVSGLGDDMLDPLVIIVVAVRPNLVKVHTFGAAEGEWTE